MNVLPSVILIRDLKFKYELRRRMFSVLATMVLLDCSKAAKICFQPGFVTEMCSKSRDSVVWHWQRWDQSPC